MKILAESQVKIIIENEDELLEESSEALRLAERAKETAKINAKKIRRYIETERCPAEGTCIENEFDPNKFQCISCNNQFSTKSNLKRHRAGRW